MRSKKYTYIVLVVLLVAVSAQAGSIKGTILYEGPIPKLPPIKMAADPICHAKHAIPVLKETLVLGEDRKMANVFVHIKNAPKKGFEAPEGPAIISQKGCIYIPHVLGVRVGQTVKIKNEDGTLHNVHAMCRINKEFNQAMPRFRKVLDRTFDKAEFMFFLKCDVHPWMGAWISVMEHPYFATTGKEGTYEIKNLPPGEYQVEVWHEKLGTLSRQVKIAATDDVQEANFSLQHPTLKKKGGK